MNDPTSRLPPAPQAVLDFWLDDGLELGWPSGNSSARWFNGGPALDQEIRQRFGAPVREALAGGLADWEALPLARLALVIVLDQFPRNIFRGDAAAFAGDARARRLVLDALDRGLHESLPWVGRVFLLMPLMHAEDLRLQRRGVQEFEALIEQAPAALKPQIESNLRFARAHSGDHRTLRPVPISQRSARARQQRGGSGIPAARPALRPVTKPGRGCAAPAGCRRPFSAGATGCFQNAVSSSRRSVERRNAFSATQAVSRPAGIGRANKYPCSLSQPSCSRISRCSSVSTPLGHDFQPQRVRKIDDGLRDGAGIHALGQVVDEAAVDLQLPDRQPAQIAEARVAGTEVVRSTCRLLRPAAGA